MMKSTSFFFFGGGGWWGEGGNNIRWLWPENQNLYVFVVNENGFMALQGFVVHTELDSKWSLSSKKKG